MHEETLPWHLAVPTCPRHPMGSKATCGKWPLYCPSRKEEEAILFRGWKGQDVKKFWELTRETPENFLVVYKDHFWNNFFLISKGWKISTSKTTEVESWWVLITGTFRTYHNVPTSTNNFFTQPTDLKPWAKNHSVVSTTN